MRVAAFDCVINNADRKSGHVLRATDGAVWAIDHGVSFHSEPKLRTVIWEFAGQPLPSAILVDLVALGTVVSDPGDAAAQMLAQLLSHDELRSLARRIRDLVARGRFPDPDPDRRSFPWPPV
jgi:uncharacterized repeat protein (TIGR03843 family)